LKFKTTKMKKITLLLCLIMTSISASAQIISQYIETDSGTSPKGIEIWNNTSSALDFSTDNLVIEKGTNGSAPAVDFTIDSGVLGPNEVLIIGTSDLQAAATANNVGFYDYSFTFNGDDALVVKLGATITDVFGTPNTDPGASWEANGVDTRNQNIALLSGITTGELVGFSDPSLRFETISTTPSDIANGGIDGFGIAPSSMSMPVIDFDENYYSVNENDGSVNVMLSINQVPANDASVQVSVLSGGTAVESTHFNFTTSTVTFLAGNDNDQILTIPIIDNTSDDADLFFVLQLSNPSNANIGNDITAVYILDDDTAVPAGDATAVDANFLTSYLVDANGTAEIGAHDPVNQYLFVTNGDVVEVLDFSDLNNITSVTTLQQPSFDGVQSVAVNGNLVAVAHSAQVSTDPGAVFFYELPGLTNVTSVTVGALPDMLTFTPDGTKVLVANEGEPSDDYIIDPEGSISIIDVSGGFSGISQSSVTTLDFNAFDSDLANLLAAGVRIFGPGASVSQDLEPEYIAVSEDSQTAYAVLQENNAYARIDLTNNTITSITPFALKDHSLPENSLDTSDETDFIFNASWPIFGMLMPDGMDSFNIGGVNYLITANEGDARDYAGYAEERKLDDSDYVLDPSVFTNTDILALETNLGDINVTIASGDANGDGLFEEIYVYGGRSFSIYEADSGNFVYDSGNDFEVITAADPTYGAIFNASNSNNSFKNRSDNKGPEPEAVIVEEFNGNYYAFILLERIGGVMIYDVTNPNAPVFLQYLNSRGAVEGDNESGDLGPEGVILIRANESPNGLPLLVITNEVSATLSIYTLNNPVLSARDFNSNTAQITFEMYPNPTRSTVRFSLEDDYSIFDVMGRKIIEAKSTTSIDVSDLNAGMYFVTNSHGHTRKLIVQ
jgi:hypothetical protein